MSKNVFIGNTRIPLKETKPTRNSVIIDGEEFYSIENVDQMDPFFMTIVSSSDHWMFISSNGGLTAGRKNSENALFPYYSDDKITQSADSVGSKTMLRVVEENKVRLWIPFSSHSKEQYATSQNLYKNQFGSKIIFEEINHDLGLKFSYSWQFSEKYGFVKKSELVNLGGNRTVEVLDGLQNVLPHGVDSYTQNLSSNLVNGYKRNVLESKAGIGVFTLSAMIVDRAEPSEALKATIVWSIGLDTNAILLCGNQLQKFNLTGRVEPEGDVKGTAGAYFVRSNIELSSGETKEWFIVAETAQDRAQVSNLSFELVMTDNQIVRNLKADINATSEELRKIVAKADGLQLTNDTMGTGRHISNVMFNVMRGGIFEENYFVDVKDFLEYLEGINNKVYCKYAGNYDSTATISYQDLISKAHEIADSDLVRISYEYLPLTFSRRHGDPSRPWNKFNIDLKYPDGSKKRSYEGNWRDIFQNWEALAYSFPVYAQGMIFKFLNATTIDGYNPYRITRKGIDWEVIEPDDPWSYIGYWGDHQIIYLQRLLECAHRHDANVFDDWLNDESFVFANVPYDIKSYDEIVADSKDTIAFNESKEEEILKKVHEWGADGKFVMENGELLKSSLTEKILITLLAKLSNFVPEAGIWLNTQRPEWNDANNALVGNGASMVTLYYMRRFCHFLRTELLSSEKEDFILHDEVASLFVDVTNTLGEFESHLSGTFLDSDRKSFVDYMGRAGEQYRTKVHQGFARTRTSISVNDLNDFLEITLAFIDHSIKINQRQDGLFHSYNLIAFDGEALKIDHLYEMLEGQVAVLSSGFLSGKESLAVLDALKRSAMFRENQFSYFLYPNRDIPHFLNKNEIPSDFVSRSKLIQELKNNGDSHLVTFDSAGICYFNGDIHNASDVTARLNDLTKFESLVETERDEILGVFEEMFDHKSFTGRSGTFFAFEGLGSIYWHMVSKLLLATQESLVSNEKELDDQTRGALVQHYYEIRAGIGINKSPELYGAFPTDPYSHTPFHKGAQQPGMTGQVKEDVLNRWAELGVKVENGIIAFQPTFLNEDEFLINANEFDFYQVNEHKSTISIQSNQLAFTYCQVPIVYEKGDLVGIEVVLSTGEKVKYDGDKLTKEYSQSLFHRDGSIQKIKVIFPHKLS